MENRDTGLLLNRTNLSLQRRYFSEMVKLLGVQAKYLSPRKAKEYTLHGETPFRELDTQVVGCVFEEHPTAKTMKKLGWNTERSESSSVISVPYDLEGLEVGGLFLIPSPFDNSKPRLFRVISISAIMIYPASLSCELAPEWLDTMDTSYKNYVDNTTNLLRDSEQDNNNSGFMYLKDDDREDPFK